MNCRRARGGRTVGWVTGYGQFCPVAKATEVLGQRWALLVVRELLCGSTRFGDIRRGMPTCPPATLTKRLRELERAGVVSRDEDGRAVAYRLTAAGAELAPIVGDLAVWGQRWVRSDYSDGELDAEVLLWDMRRYLKPGLGERTVVTSIELDVGRTRRWFWIVVDQQAVDICMVDPDRPVDLVLSTDLRTLTEVWMGDTTMRGAAQAGRLRLTGPRSLVECFPDWLGQHPFLSEVAPGR